MNEARRALSAMIHHFFRKEMGEIKKKCLRYLKEEWDMEYYPNILKVIFELEAIRGPSEKNITFSGTIELFSDAHDQKILEIYHYHFKNLNHEGLMIMKKDPKGVMRIYPR